MGIIASMNTAEEIYRGLSRAQMTNVVSVIPRRSGVLQTLDRYNVG